MAWLANAGAVGLVGDTVAAGASPADARKWWLGELARRANDAGVELAELPVTPVQVAELVGAGRGRHDQRPARPAGAGRRARRRGGSRRRWSRPAASPCMGESDELVAAVDAAIEANPDVAEKVRGGKVQAIGALVGAVMKTTRGKADAATVKRMLEERARPDCRSCRRGARRAPAQARRMRRSAQPGSGSWPRCGRRIAVSSAVRVREVAVHGPVDRAPQPDAARCPRSAAGCGARGRRRPGVPTPSRLDVVIHSAPSASRTTVRSRP